MVGVSSECFFQFKSFMLLAMQFALPVFLCLPIGYIRSLSVSLLSI